MTQSYVKKYTALREQQKKLLPLFLETQKKVAKHKRCLKVIMQENDANIPYQLQRIVDKGQEGLNAYSKLLANIEAVLKRNELVTKQIQDY